MKILFFIESLHSGGKERRLVELIKGLSNDSDYKLAIVLTRKHIHYKDIFLTKTEIYYTERKEGVRKDPKIFYKFYKISRQFKPDFIHVWSTLTAIYALPTSVFLRIPLIDNQITNATRQVSKSLLSYQIVFPFSNKIIANTYAGLKAYDAPKNKSIVIYNGFDFKRIENIKEKVSVYKEFDICTKHVVGMVANFTNKKDYLAFIDAAILVIKKTKDVTFLCVGSGDSSSIEQMVSSTYKNNILFLGRQNKVESIMNICDIGLLLTNSNHKEGISNSILEFSALSKPVIATYGGGNNEIISQNISGFLIKNNTPSIIAEKILYLLNNESKRREMGAEARKIVEKTFGIGRMITEFKDVYKEIMDQN